MNESAMWIVVCAFATNSTFSAQLPDLPPPDLPPPDLDLDPDFILWIPMNFSKELSRMTGFLTSSITTLCLLLPHIHHHRSPFHSFHLARHDVGIS